MMVIAKNSEEALLKELKSCWENFPNYRCVYLRFSQLGQNTEEWFSEFLETIKSTIDDRNGQIYLCHDQDVFVITRYMTQKRLEGLLAHLAPKLSPATSLEGLANLFEIGVDWPKLRNFCEKKIENREILAAQKREERKNDVQHLNSAEALKSLDRDLISSLGMRRELREKPEIMVVEDDAFSQKLVTNALGKHYNLYVTGDGQGAIMNYVNKAPDVLFLDIGLPDINGHEVLEKIFKLDPTAYVVMFSGNGDKKNIMRAIELGAKGFVGKPFTQEKLFQYIEKSPFIQSKQKKENTHGHSLH